MVGCVRDALLDIDELAQRMIAVVSLLSPINDQIGPFCSSEQVARLLGISRQAVNGRVKRGAILALRTADGVWVYPAFQFDGRRLLTGFTYVFAELRQHEVNRWAVAAWLVSPTAALDGTSPLEVLRAGKNSSAICQLARDALKRCINNQFPVRHALCVCACSTRH